MNSFLLWFFRPIAEFLGVVALIAVLAFAYWAFLVVSQWISRRRRP